MSNYASLAPMFTSIPFHCICKPFLFQRQEGKRLEHNSHAKTSQFMLLLYQLGSNLVHLLQSKSQHATFQAYKALC